MKYTDKSCAEFVQVLGSKEPVPGGGSVSALVGALGAALGTMVGSLTVGKKKYADVENEIKAMMDETIALQQDLIDLVQQDIDIFEPLSKLYSMKAETEAEIAEKDKLMEETLVAACMVPINIMEKCSRAIELAREYALKGSKLAVSDAGASAKLCQAAMQAASLNVYINTNSMKNRAKADELNERCSQMLSKYVALGEEVFNLVVDKLSKK